MSATAATPAPATPASRPSLARLTRVELRKAVDTRAGFWLLAAVAGVVLLVVLLISLLGHDNDHRLHEVLRGAAFPVSVLLPVVGILLVTSEWSQRTTLVTFTLVPERRRVVAAKLAASLVLALIALVVCLLAALCGTAFSGGAFALSATQLGEVALFIVVNMAMGVALGTAILSSAPAIVLSFVLPIAYSFVELIPGLKGFAHWTNQASSISALDDHLLSGTEWARAGTTLLLWLALPLAIGLWRIARSDPR